MSTWLKQSTSVDVGIGPFLDDTDGKTAETALTITQPDIRLKKNGGAWAQKNAAQTLSHEEAGWYEVTLDATDTNTLGTLVVAIHESGALPVWREFMVVPAQVWDSYLGADALQVHAVEITAGLINAAAIADGAIDAATFAAGAINAAAIAADAITDAKVAADVTIASVTGAVGSVTGNVGGNVTGSVGSLATQAKADVNAEVVDALNVDTYAEPGQEAPPATTTLVKKIGYAYKFLRNRVTQDATTLKVYGDDATTVHQKATVSDNGTTYDRGEIATGP